MMVMMMMVSLVVSYGRYPSLPPSLPPSFLTGKNPPHA